MGSITGLKWQETKDLSSETRQSILVLRNEGYSMREIAKKLKINVNSEQATPGCWTSRQSSSVQCLCSFAHLNLIFLLASLRYGFFFATLIPESPLTFTFTFKSFSRRSYPERLTNWCIHLMTSSGTATLQ